MTDKRRRKRDIVTVFVIRFSPPLPSVVTSSETNADRARGRDALPDGDRWPRWDSRLDRRGQNLTKAALLGGRGPDVKFLTSVSDANGKSITTIEGLDPEGNHPLQKAWRAINVPQCGYCQSGQIMQAAALLKQSPHPTDADIDGTMYGNICRCGTYQRIRAAIKQAAGA